jgi:hypothetical protein
MVLFAQEVTSHVRYSQAFILACSESFRLSRDSSTNRAQWWDVDFASFDVYERNVAACERRCDCSPSESDAAETLCSLNFASRVRNVELGPGKRRVSFSRDAPDAACCA